MGQHLYHARHVKGRTDAQNRRRLQKRYWQDLLDYYGAKCNCCGETELFFLTLDHVNNDGYLDRNKKATTIYRKALKSPEAFQILCYNCNLGKERNKGQCPHKGKLVKYYTPPQRNNSFCNGVDVTPHDKSGCQLNFPPMGGSIL